MVTRSSASPVLGSVLVVDDEESVLTSIRRMMRLSKIHLRVASDSTAALALMEAEVPALLISDYLMPINDGIAFLMRVGVLYPQTRRLLYTGAAVTPKVYGLDVPVLFKPCSPDDFRKLVEDLAW